MEDLNWCNWKGAKPAPTSSQGFLKLLANTCTISNILFGQKSPLTMDLEKIYRNCWNWQGDHSILTHISNTQPEWFAHVLWTITRDMHSFFHCSLNPTKVTNGIKLDHPLRCLIMAIKSFGNYHQSDTPDYLKPQKPIPTPSMPDKCPTNWDNNGMVPKKPCTAEQGQAPTDHHLQMQMAAIANDTSVGCNNSRHMHHKTEYKTNYKTKYKTEYE